MGSYIISEFLKGLKSKSAKLYIMGIFALCIIANIAVVAFRSIYGNNEGTFAYNIMTYATWCFFIPYYTCIFISDIIFGQGYPLQKAEGDSLNSNAMLEKELGPTRFYLVKLGASILLAFVFLAITLCAFIVITVLFHFSEGSIGASDIADFFQKMVYAIPLWLAGIGISNMFLFLFESKLKAYLGYGILTILIERGIMLLAAEPFKLEPFRTIRTFVITQQFSLIPYPADPARNIPLTIFLGFFYFILSSCIGIIIYKRNC